MKDIYSNIQSSVLKGKKLLAVLIDPDKTKPERLTKIIDNINQSIATHIFVGGSIVEKNVTDVLVAEIKKLTKLPVVLFPGDIIQISNKADGILFLSLISGRNPDYLIGKHVESISTLKITNLEVISTGYILFLEDDWYIPDYSVNPEWLRESIAILDAYEGIDHLILRKFLNRHLLDVLDLHHRST